MAAEFEVIWDVIQHISGVTTEHMRALNQELTSVYRDHPDAAFGVALGAALGIALHPFSRPKITWSQRSTACWPRSSSHGVWCPSPPDAPRC